MWLSWFDEQSAFGPAPSEWANHETTSVVFLLSGIVGMLLGTILLGRGLTNARRVLGGAGMIVAAIMMVSFWDHGINFLFLEPSIHGWNAGFLLLPLLLVASASVWLLMATVGALRRRLERWAGAK